MKKALRFAALLGILGLTVWSAGDRPAWALEYCSDVHGTPCSPHRSERPCLNDDESLGGCICAVTIPPSGATYWVCTL